MKNYFVHTLPMINPPPVNYRKVNHPSYYRDFKYIEDNILILEEYYRKYNAVVNLIDNNYWLVRLVKELYLSREFVIDNSINETEFVIRSLKMMNILTQRFKLSSHYGSGSDRLLLIEGDVDGKPIHTLTLDKVSLELFIPRDLDGGSYILNLSAISSMLYKYIITEDRGMQEFVSRYLYPPLIRDTFYVSIRDLSIQTLQKSNRKLKVVKQEHVLGIVSIAPLVKKHVKYASKNVKDMFTEEAFQNCMYGFDYVPYNLFDFNHFKVISNFYKKYLPMLPARQHLETARFFIPNMVSTQSNNRDLYKILKERT